MGVGERIAAGVKAALCPRESDQGPSEFSPHPQTTLRIPKPRIPPGTLVPIWDSDSKVKNTLLGQLRRQLRKCLCYSPEMEEKP